MRTVAKSTFTIDLIHEQTPLAELTKLAHKLGKDVYVTAADSGSAIVSCTDREERFGSDIILGLVALECVARDESVDQVLGNIRRHLERIHFPMKGKPSDARGIGEGHIEGQ